MSWLSLSPEETIATWLSLRVALNAALFSLPLGIAAAWILARRRFPGIALLDGLIHLPLVLPPVVTGYALLLLFGNQGGLGSALAHLGIVFAFRWTGAALAAGIMAFPLLVRAIRLSIEAIDPGLEEAARSLGGNGFFVFFTITLPLALPGILSGLVLAFGRAMGEFGATITFVSNIPGETETLPSAIYTFIQTPGGDQAALRLAGISVAISFTALLGSEVLARRLHARLAGP